MTTRHLTTDHEEIRHWVQTHHGAPARSVSAIGAGQLRIDFLGSRHPDLDYPGWHDWFTVFDAQSLALSYTDNDRPEFPGTWELVHRPRIV
ncbi:hypothetical protein R1X32_10020 (plasmid) [Rhodococcus opacus]|uniref:hypothetical protein n=1 Tax=Rhodococcus opacus TaxID=37919 RepID=UPI0034D1EB66